MEQTAQPPEHSAASPNVKLPRVPWNGWLGVVFVVLVYYISQIAGGLLLSLYGETQHWTASQLNAWLTNSVTAQFLYVLIAEGLTLASLYLFMRRYNFGFRGIGLKKLRWRDLGYGILGIPVYYGLALVALAIMRAVAPGINFDQGQNIGFQHVYGLGPLILTFISLVILPPLTEEIMVRGFLYSSLKNIAPQIVAAGVTCAIFGAAHLEEGQTGLLWTAAVQFFVLSAVLIYLREKTQSLWAGILVHATNNLIAFITLFLK